MSNHNNGNIISPRMALVLQVLDDSEVPLSAKQVVESCEPYLVVKKGFCRYLMDNQLIKRVYTKNGIKGGYTITEKGAKELLEFERRVKSFLDHSTLRGKQNEK